MWTIIIVLGVIWFVTTLVTAKKQVSLLEACFRGNLQEVRDLLRRGVDINIHDENGYTPLILACDREYAEIVKELLHGGANIHTRDKYGHTALFYAAQKQNHTIVALLLQNGADIIRDM